MIVGNNYKFSYIDNGNAIKEKVLILREWIVKKYLGIKSVSYFKMAHTHIPMY